MGELAAELNRLAGTTGLDATGAANVWAGTTAQRLELVGALNVRAGNTQRRELNGVLNQLAGTTGLGVNAAAAQIAPFDPRATTWPVALHSIWAGDTAQGTADGGAIASWRNVGSIANAPWAQGTGARQPTFRQSVAALNGKESIQYDGGDHLTFDNNPNKAQPFKILAVVQATAGAGTDRCVFGRNVTNVNVLGINAANQYTMAADTALSGGTADLNPHVLFAVYNGVSSFLEVDGVQVAAGDVGAATVTLCVTGSATINNNILFTGHKPLLGIYDNTASVEQMRSLARAAGLYYGISVAA